MNPTKIEGEGPEVHPEIAKDIDQEGHHLMEGGVPLTVGGPLLIGGEVPLIEGEVHHIGEEVMIAEGEVTVLEGKGKDTVVVSVVVVTVEGIYLFLF